MISRRSVKFSKWTKEIQDFCRPFRMAYKSHPDVWWCFNGKTVSKKPKSLNLIIQRQKKYPGTQLCFVHNFNASEDPVPWISFPPAPLQKEKPIKRAPSLHTPRVGEEILRRIDEKIMRNKLDLDSSRYQPTQYSVLPAPAVPQPNHQLAAYHAVAAWQRQQIINAIPPPDIFGGG
jgi:hypothetical protein